MQMSQYPLCWLLCMKRPSCFTSLLGLLGKGVFGAPSSTVALCSMESLLEKPLPTAHSWWPMHLLEPSCCWQAHEEMPASPSPSSREASLLNCWPGSLGVPGLVLLHLCTHLAALASARMTWVRTEIWQEGNRASWKTVCLWAECLESSCVRRWRQETYRHQKAFYWRGVRQKRQCWQKKGKDHCPNTQKLLVFTKFSRSFPVLDFSNHTHTSFLFSSWLRHPQYLQNLIKKLPVTLFLPCLLYPQAWPLAPFHTVRKPRWQLRSPLTPLLFPLPRAQLPKLPTRIRTPSL